MRGPTAPRRLELVTHPTLVRLDSRCSLIAARVMAAAQLFELVVLVFPAARRFRHAARSRRSAGIAPQRARVTGQRLQRDDLAASVATGGDAVGHRTHPQPIPMPPSPPAPSNRNTGFVSPVSRATGAAHAMQRWWPASRVSCRQGRPSPHPKNGGAACLPAWTRGLAVNPKLCAWLAIWSLRSPPEPRNTPVPQQRHRRLSMLTTVAPSPGRRSMRINGPSPGDRRSSTRTSRSAGAEPQDPCSAGAAKGEVPRYLKLSGRVAATPGCGHRVRAWRPAMTAPLLQRGAPTPG